MTSCVDTDIDGFLYLSSSSLEDCTTLVVISSDEYNYLTAYTNITGSEIAEFYSLGFGLVFFGYVLSFPIRAALRAVNLI